MEPHSSSGAQLTPHWTTEVAPIVSTVPMGDATFELRLHAPRIAASVRYGQFVMVLPHRASDVPGIRATLGPRPFDVHDATPGTGVIDLVIRVKGTGTAAITGLAPGDTLTVNGPFGRVPAEVIDGARSLALVGRGAGMSPLRLFARAAVAEGIPVHAYLSARSASLLAPFCRELLSEGVASIRVQDDETTPGSLVTDALARDAAAGVIDTALVVGSRRLVAAVRAMGRLHAVRTFVMTEAPMACGFGHCKGCVVTTTAGYAMVCREGPTMPLERLSDAHR